MFLNKYFLYCISDNNRKLNCKELETINSNIDLKHITMSAA